MVAFPEPLQRQQRAQCEYGREFEQQQCEQCQRCRRRLWELSVSSSRKTKAAHLTQGVIVLSLKGENVTSDEGIFRDSPSISTRLFYVIQRGYIV